MNRGPRARSAVWILVSLAGATAFGCHREGERTNDTDPPGQAKQVRCASVTEQDADDGVEVRGTVGPLFGKDALIAPQIAGRVLRVVVREGELVRAGQELARIDDGTLIDQTRQADAVLARAQAETQLARTTEDRIRRVFEHGIAARQELDDAMARLSTARAVEAETRAAGAIARRQLGRASLRSPLAGVVLKVFRRPGELVDGTPGTPVVEVGDPTTLEVLATVPASDLVNISIDASARVTVPAMPERVFAARVSLVSPTVDRATGLGSVRVRLLPGPPPAPPIGVAALARIDSPHARRALRVPSAALHAPTGSEAELSVCGADGRAHTVLVSVGREASGQVEIRQRIGRDGAGVGAGAGGSRLGSSTEVTVGTPVVIEPVLGVEDGDVIERRR